MTDKAILGLCPPPKNNKTNVSESHSLKLYYPFRFLPCDASPSRHHNALLVRVDLDHRTSDRLQPERWHLHHDLRVDILPGRCFFHYQCSVRSVLTLNPDSAGQSVMAPQYRHSPRPDPHDIAGYERALCGDNHESWPPHHSIRGSVAEIEPLLDAEVPSLDPSLFLSHSWVAATSLSIPSTPFRLLAFRGGNDNDFRTLHARYASTANLSFVPFYFQFLTLVIVGGQSERTSCPSQILISLVCLARTLERSQKLTT